MHAKIFGPDDVALIQTEPMTARGVLHQSLLYDSALLETAAL